MKLLFTILLFLTCGYSYAQIIGVVASSRQAGEPSQYPYSTSYYVSSSEGDDNNDGLSPETAWKTVQKAYDEYWWMGNSNILFKCGDSFQGKMDFYSGNAGGNTGIYLGSYGEGAKPVISSMQELTSWTNEGGNIWSSTELTYDAEIKMVLVNGEIAPSGRYPNSGWLHSTATSSSSITDANLPATDWSGATIRMRTNDWTLDSRVITSRTGNTLNFSALDNAPKVGNGYFIENDVRVLDSLNEYYYDFANKKFYIYSSSEPSGVFVSGVNFTVGKQDYANFYINNLVIEGGNDAIIVIGNGGHFSITNSELRYSTGEGLLEFAKGDYDSTNIIIENNLFEDCIGYGIALYPFSISRGRSIVKNNTLKRIGSLSYEPTAGIFVRANNFEISYNLIDSCNYNGMGVYGDSTDIFRNQITNFCLNTMDGGGIYTTENTKVKIYENIIKGTNHYDLESFAPDMVTNINGIYLDERSNGMNVYDNVVSNVPFGIFLHQAYNDTIKNNLFYNNGGIQIPDGNGLYIYSPYENSSYGNVMWRNTVIAKKQNQSIIRLSTYNSDDNDIIASGIDTNYYSKPLNPDGLDYFSITDFWTTYNYNTLTWWRTNLGADIHSYQSIVSVSDTSKFLFLVNTDQTPKSFPLEKEYRDIFHATYSGSVILQPYTGLVLLDTTASGDVDANKFKTATGITGSNANAIDSLVKWLKDSSLWSYAQAIYPVIGGSEASHAYNLRDTLTFKLQFNGTWTHASTGMKGNGSNAYAKTGWIPNGTQIPDFNSSVGIYSRTDAQGTYVDIGALSDSASQATYYQIYGRLAGASYFQPNVWNNVSAKINSVANSKGWFFMSRYKGKVVDGNSYGFSIDGSNYTTWSSSSGNTAFVNQELYIGAQNVNGSANYYSPREYSFVWISNQSLTEAQSKTLYRIIQKYQTQLGRQVTH